MEEKWLTVKQAAEFLQCSAPTIRRRIADGSLKEFTLRLGNLTDDERQIILDGCLINYNRVK